VSLPRSVARASGATVLLGLALVAAIGLLVLDNRVARSTLDRAAV